MRKVFFNLLPAFAAILLSLASFDAMGQVIYGGVFNSVTRQRLHDVKVELMDKHYVTLDSMRNSPNNRIADRPSAWVLRYGKPPCPTLHPALQGRGI